MRISNQNYNYNNQNNVNFTSVVPLKVFIDGAPSADPKHIKRVVVALQKLLTSKATDTRAIAIKKTFRDIDRDFRFPIGDYVSGTLIRNSVHRGTSYLFTGPHAEELDKLGRKIGPAKAEGVKCCGTTKTFEVKKLINEYFKKMSEFVSNSRLRIRESINPNNRMYVGDEVKLSIYAKSNGKFGTDGLRVNIEGISFEPMNQKRTNSLAGSNSSVNSNEVNVAKNSSPVAPISTSSHSNPTPAPNPVAPAASVTPSDTPISQSAERTIATEEIPKKAKQLNFHFDEVA